jgi:uncharacterized membrane protein
MLWTGLVLFGSPLVPVGLGVWARVGNIARVNSWLLTLAIIFSVVAVWALLEMNDNTSPLNVPVYITAVIIGGCAVGMLASSLWRDANWMVRLATCVGVAVFVLTAGFFNTIWVLFLGTDPTQ